MKNSREGKSYGTNLAFTPPEYLRTGTRMSLHSTLCLNSFSVEAKPDSSSTHWNGRCSLICGEGTRSYETRKC
ncbi:hypothetical protein RIF29_29409 [Crotalaria pallida]|uniref:Uncharacterized protein n=1 Tax=Crotalaria pallida TaxID=3830 RepID=A0AAN9EGP2_CROPI